MAKTSPLTGTGKKAQKQIYKAQKYAAEQSVKEHKKGQPGREAASKTFQDIAKGKGVPDYKGKTKYEPSKFQAQPKYEPFKYKSETKYDPSKYEQQTKFEKQGLSDLVRDFERAGKGAEKIFEPVKQQALTDFQQKTIPGVMGAFGREQGAGSSALNQALAAAATNLHRGLASDFAGIQSGVASNLLGERENQRRFGAQFGQQGEQFGANLRNQQGQFGAQFGAGQEQFGANLRNQQNQYGAEYGQRGQQFQQNLANQQGQFGAQFGQGQEQFANQSALQALNARMQSANGLYGQPIPQFNPQTQNSYNPKQQQGTSGIGGSLIGGGLGALGSYAGSAAGSAALASMFSSREVKDNIRDYDKGLNVVRDLEVKQYDYNIPVDGRQNDRVGLIAEDVPSEIQAMIGNIKGVDVYGLVALLVNCVKELDMKVQMLEAK